MLLSCRLSLVFNVQNHHTIPSNCVQFHYIKWYFPQLFPAFCFAFVSQWFPFYCHACYFSMVFLLLSRFSFSLAFLLQSRFLLDIGFPCPFIVTFFAFHWLSLFVSRYSLFSPFPRASCLTLVFLFLLLSRFLLLIGFPFLCHAICLSVPFLALLAYRWFSFSFYCHVFCFHWFSLLVFYSLVFLLESRLWSMFKTLFLIGKSLPYNPRSQKILYATALPHQPLMPESSKITPNSCGNP